MSRVADIVEEKYLERLPQMLLAAGLLVVAVVLAVLVNMARSNKPNTPPVSTTASVIVFEMASCEQCDDFRRKIGKPHSAGALSAKVPLRYFDVTDGQPPKRYKLKAEIDHAPTIVVFDVYEREVARVTGMPKSSDAFQAMLAPIARRAERDLADARVR